MLVYGTLSGEPLSVEPRTLIVGSKRVEGFWLGEWVRRQSLLAKFFLMRKLGKLIRDGTLATPVGATYPLDQVGEAVRAAAQPAREGKILLRIAQ